MIGIIALSAYKLTTKAIARDRLLWGIYLVSAAITVVTETEFLAVFVGSGLPGMAPAGATVQVAWTDRVNGPARR